MKGIILAGGNGTRMLPITLGTSKQLLPVYDKPMIYYPLSVLMLAGIRDIQIISAPADIGNFRRLLGDGSSLGLTISYAQQAEPRGIAESFIISSDHIGDDDLALVLGDNIFHGPGFGRLLQRKAAAVEGCVLFGYPVRDPERYGVAGLDAEGRLVSIEEKPHRPKSDLAVTGLYFYDNSVIEIARSLTPSARGELEITDVNQRYVDQGRAELVPLGRGFMWMDAGTHDSLGQAGQYVRILEHQQGVRIACIEEIAWRMNFIDRDACFQLGSDLAKSPYGQYIMDITKSG